MNLQIIFGIGAIVIGSLLAIKIFIYKRQKHQQEQTQIPFSSNEREFSLEELEQYNGIKKPQVYISIKGIVLDVSVSDFYRVGGGYHVFAGKDCSVSLAKMSFDEEYLNTYHLTKLTIKELEILEDWYSKLSAKYNKIGFVKQNKKIE